MRAFLTSEAAKKALFHEIALSLKRGCNGLFRRLARGHGWEAARTRSVPSSAGGSPAEGRLIDLRRMANVRITVERLSGAATVSLDNLRLLAAGAEKRDTKLPVITDDSAFVVPAVLPPSKPTPPAAPAGKRNTAPLAWEPPVTIPLVGM